MPNTARLVEAASFTIDPRGTGQMLIKLIDAGEGSSAIYPAEALQEAATDNAFTSGLHMYLDHATESHRGPHGERSIRDLASVLTEDATWDDSQHALVSAAKPIAGYESLLESLAPHVGLSISALAEVDPPEQVGGKPIFRRFVAVESVDWVTHAGRGGAVMGIVESANLTEANTEDRRNQLTRAVCDMYEDRAADIYAWVQDFDDVARTVWYGTGGATWEQSYTVADDDLSVALTGERTEVRPITQFVPVTSTASITETHKEKHMPEITQAELDAATVRLNEATARAEAAEAKLAEAEHAKTVTEARKTATAKVTAATEGLPAPVVARIASAVEARIDSELPADIDAQITAAIEAEKTYLAAVVPSSGLTGFGQSVTESATQQAPKRTHNAFGRKIQEA